MRNEVKEFIEKNISLIEKNSWEEIYEKARNDLEVNTGEFTETMLTAGIHPEKYLTKLPKRFLSESNVEEFEIPDNIKSISDYAFAYCKHLAIIIIRNPEIIFGDDVFWCCNTIDIQFAGTKKQWETIAKRKFSGIEYTCTCIDGTVKKSR